VKPSEIPVNNEDLLRLAFRHRSAAEDSVRDSYERLEFFGDSVLGLVIAEYLYDRFPCWDQGMLSKAKATLVQEAPLAEAAERLGFDRYIQLGTNEEDRGANRPSILADVFEAVVGAIYLDQGLDRARWFVLESLQDALDRVARGEIAPDDYKSRLQEVTQARWKNTPSYRVVADEGPSHDRLFKVEVLLGDEVMGTGKGRSKKEAEQAAAKSALELIERAEASRYLREDNEYV
jgi:ribonuclease-3